MTYQQYNAIIALLAIVIIFYAVKNEHATWLPDLAALALALAAPRQELAIGAVALLILVRHSPLARGLADGIPLWALALILPGAIDMSISDEESAQLERQYQRAISGQNPPTENIEIPRPVAEKSPEEIYLLKVEDIARSVVNGTMKLTPATQLLAGVKGGKKYQAASRVLKAEITRQQNHYPPSSPLRRF